MIDPFDKTRCSFPVPDFAPDEEEQEWRNSLTFERWLEVMYWIHVYRYGEKVVNARIERSTIELLTMQEFCGRKEAEDEAEDKWRVAHGLKPYFPKANREPS